MNTTNFNANHKLETINVELNKIGYQLFERHHFGSRQFVTAETAAYCEMMDGVYDKKADAVARANELLAK